MDVTALASLTDNVSRTTYETGSYTPSYGKALIAVIVAAAAAASNPSGIVGNGLTWVLKDTRSNLASTARMYFYLAKAGLPSAGTLAVTWAIARVACLMSIFEVGAVLSPPGDGSSDLTNTHRNVVKGGDTGVSSSLTMGNPAGGLNRPFAAWAHAAIEATTPRAGWTEIHDLQLPTTALSLETQWRSDSWEAACSADWATSSEWLGIVWEVQASRDRAMRLGLRGRG